MENPFTALGEAIHDGLDRLHKRADTVEGDVGTVKADLKAFAEEVNGKLTEFGKLEARVVALENLLAPEAITAATDKVSSAGGDAPKPADPVTQPPLDTSSATVITAPSGATVVTNPASGTSFTEPSTSVVVQPGTTVHSDASGTTTTVPHDGSEPTATDNLGAVVEPASAAVAEATDAASDAGVMITPAAPSPAAEPQPVIA